MKIMVASDIHGSTFYGGMMLDRFYKENADKLVLLGDLYAPNFDTYDEEDDSTMTLPEMLNTVSNKLIVIKGNCDSSMDEMVSNFPFYDIKYLEIGDKKVCFTHGNKYNISNVPPDFGDILIYGHLHTGFIIKEGGKIFANPGSVACPRNRTPRSYIVLTETEITLKEIDGQVIDEKKL